jgi:hypothetical protein
MAGDSALLAMSTSRRMPKPTSWTMVRSNPTWTAPATAAARASDPETASRGEYWPEAICRATIVRANTRPVTVIMVDETTISSERASSAGPWKASPDRGEPSSTSTRDRAAPASRNAATDSVGSTHRAPPT